MTQEHDLDMERLPHEIRRALDAETILVDQLDPGLYVEPEADHLVVLDRHGNRLCAIPRYRLHKVDPEMLVTAAKNLPATSPGDVALADQLDAAGQAGALVLVDPPDAEHVAIVAADQASTAIVLHRALVVPGWPKDEHREGGDQ
jgi:hypothetical protein